MAQQKKRKPRKNSAKNRWYCGVRRTFFMTTCKANKDIYEDYPKQPELPGDKGNFYREDTTGKP